MLHMSDGCLLPVQAPCLRSGTGVCVRCQGCQDCQLLLSACRLRAACAAATHPHHAAPPRRRRPCRWSPPPPLASRCTITSSLPWRSPPISECLLSEAPAPSSLGCAAHFRAPCWRRVARRPPPPASGRLPAAHDCTQQSQRLLPAVTACMAACMEVATLGLCTIAELGMHALPCINAEHSFMGATPSHPLPHTHTVCSPSPDSFCHRFMSDRAPHAALLAIL